MIKETLGFIKDKLNTALKARLNSEDGGSESEKDLVEFVNGEKQDPLTFSTGVVSMLLVGIEQERVMRRADPYRSVSVDGSPKYIKPEIRLQVSVLFVAQFKQYDVGLNTLSEIIYFFQENPLFLQGQGSVLPEKIERISLELVSMTLAEQNEVWSGLRAAYRPSLLYKVGLLVFNDQNAVDASKVTEVERITKHKESNG